MLSNLLPDYLTHQKFWKPHQLQVAEFSCSRIIAGPFPFKHFCLIVSHLFHFLKFPVHPNQKHPLRASSFLVRPDGERVAMELFVDMILLF